MGYVYTLPEKEQEALVEAGRLSVKELRLIDRSEHEELDEYHKVYTPRRRDAAPYNGRVRMLRH